MRLLYLHGFISSPASAKAVATRSWLEAHAPDIGYTCPFLSPYPDEVTMLLEKLAGEFSGQDLLIVGSSMGGYYGTWLAEKLACKAVLVNPAVSPWLGGARLLGPQQNYHTGERYYIEQRHLDALQALDVPLQDPRNYWVLLQTGDDVLDYRLAQRRYAGARVTTEEGGDHSFQGFERFLPGIMQFWTKNNL